MSTVEDRTEETTELPFHLRGHYAPVTEEITAVDLAVEGTLPADLSGTYVRNGANPQSGWSSHWFDGDGMLHGVRLRDGRAEWYRNRWVRTKMLAGGRRMDPATGVFDLTAGRANTHVIRHADRILALEEASFPNEVTPELETVGPYDFGGRLHTPMTAHPHLCAETGELHFFGYELVSAPFITYHVADAAGNLVHSQPIDVPGPTMVHDFAISRHYAIFLDLPVTFSLDLAMQGGMPFAWDETYGARIGLLHRDRAREGAQPVWFEIDPCYVFHIMNAWDEPSPNGQGDVVVLDAGRHATMWKGGTDQFDPSLLWRWRFDLATGRVTEEQFDDRAHAFPRIDDRRSGLAYRYGWAAADRDADGPRSDRSGIVKYDVTTGERWFRDLGPEFSCGEPVFVPADGATGEDEGYLTTFVHDHARGVSSFAVFDAQDPGMPTIATVPIPQRVPHGFHGSWFAD